jgi:hypothetical protein
MIPFTRHHDMLALHLHVLASDSVGHISTRLTVKSAPHAAQRLARIEATSMVRSGSFCAPYRMACARRTSTRPAMTPLARSLGRASSTYRRGQKSGEPWGQLPLWLGASVVFEKAERGPYGFMAPCTLV